MNLNTAIMKVKCISSWLCLLCNYVTMMHGQQNINPLAPELYFKFLHTLYLKCE
jgi:hypothetical protein